MGPRESGPFKCLVQVMRRKKPIKKRRPAKAVKARTKARAKMSPPDSSYPARSSRSHLISGLGGAIGRQVKIAGRVMDVATDQFVLADESGTVQVRSAELPEKFSIVEVNGRVIKYEQGVLVELIDGRELAPVLREPKNSAFWERALFDQRYREIAAKRSRILYETRKFFVKRGFLEVETPALVAIPGMEPNLNPFETEIICRDSVKSRTYLITSPEYCLKKLLSAGFGNIFEISRCYRNGEEKSDLHNPEFLMLEWYRPYASYLEIMDDVEALIRYLARSFKKEIANFRGIAVKLDAPFERLSVTDAFLKYAAIDLEENLEADAMRKTLRAKGYRPGDRETYEELFFRVFLNEIEPCLGRKTPTILHGYPSELAALAKRNSEDPRFAERFELYIAGTEIANAFTELNDPAEQKTRLQNEYLERKRRKKTLFGPDSDFLDALLTGMPPSGGIALGLDRLIMVLLERNTIGEVRLFPATGLFPEVRGKK